METFSWTFYTVLYQGKINMLQIQRAKSKVKTKSIIQKMNFDYAFESYKWDKMMDAVW